LGAVTKHIPSAQVQCMMTDLAHSLKVR
jgi:hypothetical protein